MAKRTVLITGCSDGSLGSALAQEFHTKGHRVFATARNAAKLADVQAAGIETLHLDVLSTTSIQQCVAEIQSLTGGTLDMLVNNAGTTSLTPLSDASIADGKALFDINLWAPLAMTQAFLPLLLRSSHGGTIVNHSSLASILSPPFVALYGASKAALSSLTTSLRAELAPFGLRVVELKTGNIASNLLANQAGGQSRVRRSSLYWAARDWLDEYLSGKPFAEGATAAEVWAGQVVAGLSSARPPDTLWVGRMAWAMWVGSCLPSRVPKMMMFKAAGIELIREKVEAYGRERAIADAYGAA